MAMEAQGPGALGCARCLALRAKQDVGQARSPPAVLATAPELIAELIASSATHCYDEEAELLGARLPCFGSLKHRNTLANMCKDDGSTALTPEEVAQMGRSSLVVRVEANERNLAALQLVCKDSAAEMQGTTLTVMGGTDPVPPDAASSWFPPLVSSNVHCKTCGMGLGALYTPPPTIEGAVPRGGNDEALQHAAVAEPPRGACLGLKIAALKAFWPSTGPLSLAPGAAIMIQGVESVPELNGQRGLVEGFDEEKGRYRIAITGRARAIGLRPANCLLTAVEVDPIPEL